MKFSNIAIIALFCAFIAVCAWITVPFAVPFTLQIFGIFLTLSVLGGKKGLLAVFCYVLLGLIGLPVFSGFRGGLSQLFSVSGGYIIGFLLAAITFFVLESTLNPSKFSLIFSLIISLLVCYTSAITWFLIFYATKQNNAGVLTALTVCVLPYIIPDILKLLLVVFVRKRIVKALKIN